MSSQVLIERSAPRGPAKIWPLAIVPLSGFIAWAVNTGGEGWRWLFLGGMAWSMVIALLGSLEAGLIAMMVFEPFRGFLRRAQYLFLPYSATDPIHILTPLVTLLAFVLLLQRKRLGIFRETPLAGLVSLLGLIYLMQIFNPLQGGLAVGLSGALFFLVPVVWFYFGQALKPDYISKILRLMVVLGLITSLHGLYQLTFGLPAFEQYWIDHTDVYDSISIANVQRALATFSSAEEWGRYIALGAIVAFGFAARASSYLRRAGWYLSGAALTAMLLLSGQRTSIFGLMLGVFILFLSGARTRRAVMGRLALALIAVSLVAILAKAPTNDEILSHTADEKVQTVLSHTASGTLRPTSEDSLQERLDTWSYLATTVIPSQPLGAGLGATSLGVKRFDSSGVAAKPIDSNFVSLAVACSLPAALLFMWILIRATSISWRSYRSADPDSPEARTWRVVAALMPVLILNSVFGNNFTLYSVAPLGWLLVGWISAQKLAQKRLAEAAVQT